MPLLVLLASVFSIGLEALVQLRFGPMGFVGLLLLSIGIRARNATFGCVGAVVLTLLMATGQ
ncbi:MULTISPECIES: hypothetical protein [unclassified Streptomyces]|uniref:hypothetical protein n=1 Tax=unclassified Streptomyces TaxID=2593676 RepID=UPI00380F1766